jgi:hypothetical protein
MFSFPEQLRSDRKYLLTSHRNLVHRTRIFWLLNEVERLSADICSDLHRKEVIQAHLPVHLPCYDFVPVTNPTLDGSLSCELGYRLQVLPASMT